VTNYLSGICQQLETYFPNAHEFQHPSLVTQTLKGCLHLKGTASKRKHALTLSDLLTIFNNLSHSRNHDDLLFLSMLFTGFFALM
jgi:hypothetical protein